MSSSLNSIFIITQLLKSNIVCVSQVFSNRFSFIFSICLQKSSNQKHCILFKASRHGIERLEILDKEDDKNPKIITLENCVKIAQEPAPANQITIVMKTGTLTLNALNETELKHWVQALQNVAFKDKSSTLARNSVMEEENDLYCSTYGDGDGIFTVVLHESDATLLHCSLEAKSYTMHLTTTEIQLKSLDVNGATVVAKWPYRFIRKYGYSDGKIKFEAGRKCDTGEGEFKFHHSNPKAVFRCLADKMKSMKKLINGDSTVSTLDCGENQFNAALSMEPGSRSPLPHSDNDQSQSSHLLRGFLSSNDSLNNVSLASSTVSNISAVMKITPCKPPRKSLPTDVNEKPSNLIKPQRPTKFLDYEPVSLALTGTNDLSKSIVVKASPPPLPTSPHNLTKTILSNISDHHMNIKSPVHSPVIDQPPQIPTRYESMIQDDRDYERIETISNAWKTRGVNDVKHTENLSPDDDFADFAWQRSQSQKETGTNRKVPIVVNAYCDADDLLVKKKTADDQYDKLDFFAPKPSNPSADYRTIVTVNTPHTYKKQSSQPITSNDYEIIGENMNNEQKSYRLADDSYMGYGVLRKPGVNNNTAMKSKQSPPPKLAIDVNAASAEDLLNHRKYNGLEYAMVSKPKQV